MHIGVFEAKSKMSEILRRVEAGEEFTITKHGQPIARLSPIPTRDPAHVQAAVTELKKFAKGRRLDGLSIREMRNLGRQNL